MALSRYYRALQQQVDGDKSDPLASAVRALVTSVTEDQRELEKERLLISHAETAAVIDDLIEQNENELQECLVSFGKVSSRASACHERLQKVRNDIGLCKFFLQRKRDELRQLWRQYVEQRRIVEIIEQIEAIRNATRGVEDALSHGHYLDAAQRLKWITMTSDACLSSFGALSQIRQEIHRLTEEIYKRCVASLNIQLFARPCEELRVQRQGAARGYYAALHAECSQASESDRPQCDESGLPLDNLTKTSPPVQHFAVICEALGVLGRLDDALDECRRHMRTGLWRCVQSALKETEKTHGKDHNGESKRRSAALQLLFRLFSTSVTLHMIMLQQARRVAASHNVLETIETYDIDVVYYEIQRVLVQLLEDSLGTSNVASANQIQFAIANSLMTHSKASDRDLLLQDFEVIEHYSFLGGGTATSPPHPYGDFRFKTYAPVAFKHFRDLFRIRFEDFLSSLCESTMVELANAGASGSVFYRSSDDQFILKTVQSREAEFLIKLLPGYYMQKWLYGVNCKLALVLQNLQQNPRTLLPKFFGLYCLQTLSKNVRLIVMNNLLPSSVRIHMKYDLKGSTYMRQASKSEREKELPTLKDLDFLEDHPGGIYLAAETYDELMKTISRDCLVLESFEIMDYSLLLGVHNVDREKRENFASVDECQPSTSFLKLNDRAEAAHRPWHRAKLANCSNGETGLLADYPTRGVPARNSKGEQLILYMGIIDILQHYRMFKKFEHAWKSVLHDGSTISVHRPSFYARRFRTFIAEKVFRKVASFEQSSRNLSVEHGPYARRRTRSFS